MNLELKPEQHDPLAYEIESLKRHIRQIAEAGKYLSPEIPAEEEQLWMGIYQLESIEQQLKELVFKQELRSKPNPPSERYLKLVWSQS